MIKNSAANLKGIITGNRIPREYFITRGVGQSNIAIHAGSYHLALKDAGIERANIMTYSSILPPIAKEIAKPDKYTHGEVIECIMTVANGNRLERLSAGIIFGWLYDVKTKKKYGGLVCEHYGNYPLDAIEERLNSSLQELYTNGFEEQFELRDIKVVTQTYVPEKQYGTALVAICFVNHYVPVLGIDK